MINTSSSRMQRRRISEKKEYSVWSESNKRGGYIIFCGIRGTDSKTIVGAANSRETLEYNIRKAKVKMGIKI